jgi:lipid-A-disaccharide synthase
MLQVAQRLSANDPALRFVMPAANQQREAELRTLLAEYPQLPLTLVTGQSREVMSAADALLLASGTATLEALLLHRPMAITYKLAPLSWALVSRLVTTAFAGLPNVLAGRSLVPEFIQDDATVDKLAAALRQLLDDEASRQQQLESFSAIAASLRLGFAERSADALLRLIER